MRRSPSPRLLTGVALVAVAAVTAIVVVLAVGLGGPEQAGPIPALGPQRIQATAALSPQAALFGDTVTAHVDVTFDRAQYDPDDLRVAASFVPWATVGAPTVTRRDAGPLTFLRTTYVLRCVEIRCVPSHESTLYQFRPARVLYAPPAGESAERLTLSASFPGLVMHSRLDQSGPAQRDRLGAPWRADAVSLPAVTYRASPGWTIALVLTLGLALLALGGALAYRARPRRAPPLPPPPPPPPPRLAPLEQALLLLEAPAAVNGDAVEERRRALELVADEVATWGDRSDLEREARRLAWSEADPEPNATRALAVSVRAHTEETDGAATTHAEETDGASA